MDGEKQASSRRMEIEACGQGGEMLVLHFAMPDRQGIREQEALFDAGLHSLVVRSSPGYAFSRKISVAGPGSGGIDTFVWLPNRMVPTCAEARQQKPWLNGDRG